jgi:hypothetical protein
MMTRNGAACTPTNINGTLVRAKKVSNTGDRRRDFIESNEGDWCWVQMLPAIPQRFEWVRKENLV